MSVCTAITEAPPGQGLPCLVTAEQNALWEDVSSLGNVVQLQQQMKGMKLVTEGLGSVKASVLQHEG